MTFDWETDDDAGSAARGPAGGPADPGEPGNRTPAAGTGLSTQARLTAWVRGRVQGVGFRWWVRTTALELGLTGVAENLLDGRVKVVAEGNRESCAMLLSLLAGPETPGYVVEVTHRWDQARGGLSGFVERLSGAGMPCHLRKRQLDRMALVMGPWKRYLRATWRGSAFLRARPLWSLSVEDLKQWRRLCLAMLAGLIPAWFLRCADSSAEFVTLKPS